MTSFDFSGKNYIVTGAAGSIGQAIVHLIAAGGGRVTAVDIDREALQKLSTELPGEQCQFRIMDLSSVGVIRDGFREIINGYGQLHGLVNCVGVISVQPFEQISQEEWDRTIGINLTGVFAAIQAVFSHMKERGYGRIVNVSSVAGKTGGGIMGRGAYVTSKAGLNGLTKVVAKEGGPFGICCNAISQGWTDSRMVNDIMTGEDYERIRKMVSLGRPATVWEAAYPVAFYLSDLASFVNGEISDVDGGLTFD